MIKIKQKGDFKNLDKFLVKTRKKVRFDQAEQFASTCVERLKEATPSDTGLTAASWNYTITRSKHKTIIDINNTNIQNGINVALLIEFGHGTRYGTYVEGKEYIAPIVLKTYLDIIDNTWKGIKRL